MSGYQTCYSGNRVDSKTKGYLPVFTVHKRSLGQDYIFSSVCQEFCPQGVHGLGGGAWSWGSGPGGYVEAPPPFSYCRGQYASYWNAFLFLIEFCRIYRICRIQFLVNFIFKILQILYNSIKKISLLVSVENRGQLCHKDSRN